MAVRAYDFLLRATTGAFYYEQPRALYYEQPQAVYYEQPRALFARK